MSVQSESTAQLTAHIQPESPEQPQKNPEPQVQPGQEGPEQPQKQPENPEQPQKQPETRPHLETQSHPESPEQLQKQPHPLPEAEKTDGEESCSIVCACHRTRERTEKEYKDLIHRLNRIEGQVRGIRGMVEKDAYCPEILTQVAAVTAALGSFNKVLLANHIRTCVARDIRDGRDETIDELVNTLQKLMR